MDVINRCSNESKAALLACDILLRSDQSPSEYISLACRPDSGSIVFPFYNPYGDLIAISFRPIVSDKVIKLQHMKKYWHTAFKKRFFLYGLDKIERKIRTLIVGEGQ